MSQSSSITITPLKEGGLLSLEATEVDFGAIVTGLDLAKMTDEQFLVLQEALWKNLVLIIPGQGHLTGPQQLELTRRFDPEATVYGHGSDVEALKKSVLSNDLISLPSAPEVKLLGNGPVAEHDGMADLVLKHPMHFSFHRDHLRPDDYANTRYYRWHIDAALYERNPPRVTTLLALQVPEGEAQTVRYDDGSGETLSLPLATTAFVSGEYGFQQLSPEAKAFALRSRVRYHPHPYVWMKTARALPTGLGLYSEGRELTDDKLPPSDEKLVCYFPSTWKNPVTGKLALQMHPCAVEDFIVPAVGSADVHTAPPAPNSKEAETSTVKSVRLTESGLIDGNPQEEEGGAPFYSEHEATGLGRVRRVVNALMRPNITPSRVLAHKWKNGDMVIFANRQVLHTVVGTLKPTDVRIYHQVSRFPPSTIPCSSLPCFLASRKASRFQYCFLLYRFSSPCSATWQAATPLRALLRPRLPRSGKRKCPLAAQLVTRAWRTLQTLSFAPPSPSLSSLRRGPK
jgi:xanthine dioxygenase